VGAGLKTFTVTDADAEKLAELVREAWEYKPAYYETLAAAVLWQLEQQAQLNVCREECSR
jgi:hypothetical protein